MHPTTFFSRTSVRLSAATLVLALAVACGGNPPPTVPGADPVDPIPGSTSGNSNVPPPPVTPPSPPTVSMPPEPAMTASPYDDMTVDQINEAMPLKPVFFEYDSEELSDEARRTLSENAEILRQQTSWTITIEGHCDERGTPEYNLALGDRRALAAKNYLQSLGISASRLGTVSYGKEFPFDPAHNAEALRSNRRAHLVLTAK